MKLRHAKPTPWLARLLMFTCLLARGARAQTETSSVPAAETEVIEECSRQHDDARMFLLQERWAQAQRAFQRCLDPSCPVLLRSDCGEWQAELERSLATLYLALPASTPLTGAVMTVDDATLPLTENPDPLRLLPGKHRVVFNRPDYLPDVHEIELRKGEVRQLNVRWIKSISDPPIPELRPIPATTYWFSVGAVTLFATSAVFGGLTFSSLASARQNCAPMCSEDRVRTIENLALVADSAFVLGMMLSTFAVVTYIERPALKGSAAPAPLVFPKVGISQKSLTLSIGSQF